MATKRKAADDEEVEAEAEIVPGEIYPHTEAIPQTGEGDMGYSPAPENLPSVPSIELPPNVHDYSGGTHTVVSVPIATVEEADD